MSPQEYLMNTKMTDEQANLKIEWEASGRKINHPFIWMIMENYKNL